VGVDEGTGWSTVRDETNRLMSALEPWDSGTPYLSMADGQVTERRAWSPDAARRLESVRAQADPDGLFVAPRSRG
jgi:hypothetical protein